MNKAIKLILCCLLLVGCNGNENVETDVTQNEVQQEQEVVEEVECLYKKKIKKTYILNNKKITMSATLGPIDNLYFETDEENDVLNMYFVYCNIKHLITALEFLSTENCDLANVELEEPLQKYLDENGLQIYLTDRLMVVGTRFDYILEDDLQAFGEMYDEEATNAYAKTLNDLFGLNHFSGIESVWDISR